jgi:tetratricopeptide (TPR) repeat protein
LKEDATPPSAQQAFSKGQALYRAGDVAAAMGQFVTAAEVDPSVGKYQRHAGLTLWQLGNRQRGEQHLLRAVALDPNDAQAHATLSQLYLEAARLPESMRHARQAVALAPNQPEPALALAMALEADRQTQEAWAIVQQFLDKGQRIPPLAFIFARMAPNLGQEERACQVIEETITSGQLQHARQEASLRYLSAQLLDRLGRYDQAIAQARRAHQLVGTRYVPSEFENHVDNIIQFFTADKVRQLPRAHHDIRSVVFIVGMPRSGSTLVEQILGSHPAIHAAGELGWMFRIAGQAEQRAAASGLKMPRCQDILSPNDIEQLAAQYLHPLIALNPTAARITDKNLANFLTLGLIQLLIPQAKIIHCRRDPLDTCISCYTNEFVGYDFGLELETVGHFYKQYERLMAHWPHVLDLPILDVDYEQVVADLEGQARRLLEFLELPWDPRCLEFHQSRRFIGTASNEQVRKPVYKSSIQRWRHYEKHLRPLRAALGMPASNR